MAKPKKRPTGRDLDRDPRTGQPEDHLGGVATGAVTGGITGGVAGAAVAGATTGTIAEDEYWRNEFPTRPYVISSRHGWDDYAPAYRLAYERYPEYHGRSFEEVEPEFSRHWDEARGESRLSWAEAREATRDAYEHLSNAIERAAPGDADRDGR